MDASLPVEVYAIDGRQVGEYPSLEACRTALAPGVYVIKNATSTIKIAVK